MLLYLTMNAKIQSISDLITNSSTEVFVVYHESNIEAIKNLVDSILSLLDPSKKFDDYFAIEMEINYDDLNWIFERYYEDEEYYDDIPELVAYRDMGSKEASKFLETLPIERIKKIFDWANNNDWDRRYQLYEGFIVNAKSDDPIVRKVAIAINNVDNIFDIDYSSDY